MRYLLLIVTTAIFSLPAIGDNDAEHIVTAILAKTPLIDGHNDLPLQYRIRVNNQLDQLDLDSDLTELERPTHTDIPRLRKGMVGGQFWSVYVPIREYPGQDIDPQLVAEQIDLVKRIVARYSDDFELAITAADVRRIHASGKIASMIGMEGGHAINNSLAMLRMHYDLGARYMTLTHSKGLRWADSATDEERHGGLTAFGELVIQEMNRLGMLIDLSHVSVDTMKDVLAVTEAPVIFSHSSAYAVVRHSRNVPDDVLGLVRNNDGVVMVTFYPLYVSEDLRQHKVARDEERDRLKANSPGASDEEIENLMSAWQDSNPAPRSTLEQVADHIDHIRDVAGIDHIGLGGDYDGMPPGPVGLEDVSTYPALFIELLDRGYSRDDLAKIAGENVLRVMSTAEQVAAELQQTLEPADALIDEVDGADS